MMKRKITIIILVLVLAVLSTGCFSPKPWFLDFKKDYDVDKEERVDITSRTVENIELKLISKNIRILKSDNSDMNITISGSIESNFTPDIYIQDIGKTVEIRDSNKTFNNSDYKNNDLNFTIYVPEELYKDLSVDTITGNITIDGIKFKDLETNNISGSTKVNSIESNNLEMDSVSGNMEVHNSSIFSIELDTVSGKSILDNIKTRSVEFNSVSGSLDSQGEYESFRGDTVSGDVTISVRNIQDDYIINTVSGDVTLDISDINGFNFRFNSLSGEIETEKTLNFNRIHNDTIEGSYGSGGSLINLKTTSGDLVIN